MMPDGDTTISALYKEFEQAVASYLAIPGAEDKEKFERGLDEAAAIAERIVRLPAADINDMLVKIRMVAWDRGERFTSLAELVINLQTARTLGIDVPSTLLARADEVIE